MGVPVVLSGPRNFILVDDRLLLLQDKVRLDRAEVIRDQKRIGALRKRFDETVDKISD